MLVQTLPPAPPALIAPITESSRDEFPKCRAAGGGGPVVYTCPQTRLYWLQLDNPETLERTVIDAEIHAGYIPEQGGGEITRLAILVAAEMPGWEITGLSLADEPDTEF